MGPRPSVRGVEQRAGRKGPRASAWECLAVCSLTPRDRGRVLEQGWSISEAARQAAVSRQTASKWVARYRAGGSGRAARPLDATPPNPPSGTRARRTPDRAAASAAPGVPPDCLNAASRALDGLPGFSAGLACSGSRVLNPYPIRTATSGLTPGSAAAPGHQGAGPHGHHLSGTPAGGQKTCPARGGMEHRKTCVLDAVLRARSGHSRDRLPPGSVQRRWSEGYFSSGGGRESNPPASPRPPTDFEGMSGSCAAFRLVTSAFAFRRRPSTCKDL